MLDVIQNAYAMLDQLHVSVTGLVAAMIVFALAFLFAVREAAAWFFKVDDIKRDIARLHEISLQLEGEVKLMQNLLAQVPQVQTQATAAQPTAPHAAEPAPLFAIAGEAKAIQPEPSAKKEEATARGGFPIVH